MKKILAIMLVAVFAATGAYAEDRLKLSGQMRVQGFSIENYGDWDDNTKADEMDWWQQRFRTAATINVADGVSLGLRFDFAENTWGDKTAAGGAWDGSRFTGNNELQVDRAFLKVDKEMFSITAGQQYIGLGNSIVYDNNTTGFKLDIKTPVVISLVYTKEDENGANTDDDTLGTEDTDSYAVNIGYATEAFSVNAFYAIAKDHSNTDNSPEVYGLQGTAAFGPVNLNAELDVFGGDKSATVEYVGTQFYLDANMALGAGKIGANFIYAIGTDDPTEDQIFELTDFGSHSPMSFGLLEFTDFDVWVDGIGGGAEVYEVGGFGSDSGAVGFDIYGEMKFMESLTGRALIGYVTPSEDDATALDSVTLVNLGLQYDFAPNTALLVSYNYTAIEFDNTVAAGTADDPASALMSKILVNF